MHYPKKLFLFWADYRVSLGVIAVAAALCAFALSNATQSSGQSPEDEIEAGKLARQEASTDSSVALCQTAADCATPPPRSRFVTGEGFYFLPPWDDRHLSEAEKAADPWIDPFWPAFVECMQAGGVGVGSTTPETARQPDIDRLVAEVNESGPHYARTPVGFTYQSSPKADVFQSCETILWEKRPTS